MASATLKDFTHVSTDEQLDALDNFPILFDDLPDIPEIPAHNYATTTTAKAEPATLETLKEQASIEKMDVENALKSDSRITFKGAMDKAQACVKKYNDTLLQSLFDGFLREENPALAFMTQGFYKKMRLSVNEGKEGTTVTLDEKDAFLPLARFVTYASKQNVVRSASWQSKVQRVAALLSIRAAQDIGQDVAQMLNDFDMDEKARGMVKKDVQPRAKDPISNNTLTTAMQDMIDDVLFIDNGKGQNKYKVVTPALMYFKYVLFHRGSKPGTIATPRAGTVENYLVELAHMMIHGVNFSMEYNKIKTVEVAAKAA